jgi:NADH-quinone oxidoreductase subunit G
MCDHGRLNTFKNINAATRIKTPLIRKEGKLIEVSWDEAIAKIAFDLKTFRKNEIAALGSAYATNEDNYLLMKFMHFLGVKRLDVVSHEDGTDDALLLRGDKTPNSRGAREVGIRPESTELGYSSIINDIRAGKIKALYLIDDNIATDPTVAEVLGKLDLLVVHASNLNETTKLADVVLASSTYAEKHGTFINFQGRVQRNVPAIATLEHERILDGMSLSRLDKFGAHNDSWTKGVKRDSRATWRIINSLANVMGAKWKYPACEDVFTEITGSIPAFRGLTYLKIGKTGAMLNTQQEHVTMKR